MTRATCIAIALAGLSACSVDSVPGPSRPVDDLATLVVSNPVAPVTSNAAVQLVQTSSYVSMPPGTATRGVEVTVRNLASNASVTVFMFGGGFDPIPIVGSAGDTLDVTVRGMTGQVVLHSRSVVPTKKKPTIIRTSPPPQKRDVPLNAVIRIVFTEPVDPQTVTPGNIKLIAGSDSLSGSVQLDPSGLHADLTPASALQPSSTYRVFVKAGITDLTGDAVDGLIFEFTTEPPASPPPQPQPESPFIAIGDMTTARWGHTSTLLPNGRVLLTGGDGIGLDGGGSSAEIYDPATGKFSATGSMQHPRRNHHAILLPSGKVLLVGPDAGSGAELYDPAAGTFTWTGSPLTEQYFQSATLLQNGLVLVAGEVGAELYDPATGTFSLTGPFARPVYANKATLLNDGRVLFAGDYIAQLYDPERGAFSIAGETGLDGAELHTQTLLANGKVLMAGGMGGGRYDKAALFDPSTSTFSRTGSLSFRRDAHVAVLRKDGTVLMVGGDGMSCTPNMCVFSGSVAEAELYDPVSGEFAVIGKTRAPRTLPAGTLLPNGDVLITGGLSYCGIGCMTGPLASAEMYPTSVAAQSARAP